MIGKFKVTLSQPGTRAEHVLVYEENEKPSSVTRSGDSSAFLRKDGSEMDFSEVHMDKLAFTVQHWTGETGAEGTVDDLASQAT